jgi:hypothetical protein
MYLKLLSIFSITLLVQLSLSQTPKPLSKKQWKIANIEFRRYLNTAPKLRGFFEVDHIYYEPCVTNPEAECGIRATNRTVRDIFCNAWSSRSLTDVVTEDGEFYGCNGYLKTAQGEGNEIPLPGEIKKWLKWRLFDLKETGKDSNPTRNSFQSVKVQFFNAVPIVE